MKPTMKNNDGYAGDVVIQWFGSFANVLWPIYAVHDYLSNLCFGLQSKAKTFFISTPKDQ